MLKKNLLNNKSYRMLVNPKALSTNNYPSSERVMINSDNFKDKAYNIGNMDNQQETKYLIILNIRVLRDFT